MNATLHPDRRAGSGRRAVEREFISLIENALDRGDMDIHRATEFMLEHGITPGVISRVITRAQNPRHPADLTPCHASRSTPL